MKIHTKVVPCACELVETVFGARIPRISFKVVEYYLKSDVNDLLDEIILCLGSDEIKYRSIINIIEEAKQ